MVAMIAVNGDIPVQGEVTAVQVSQALLEQLVGKDHP